MKRFFSGSCVLCVLVFVFYLFSGKAEAGAPPGEIVNLFNEANSYYGHGKFHEAVKTYEDIVNRGYESMPLYYNLGNAYFKSGSLGKAILNYRRAKRLDPLDADLNSNIEHVLSLVKQKSSSPETGMLNRIFLSLRNSFSLNSISVVYIVFFILSSLLAAGFILFKNVRKALFYAGVPLIVLFIMSAAVLGAKYYGALTHKEAVIIAHNTECRFEPFEDATAYFTLYEGDDVIVTCEKGLWVKIRRADGKQGWVKKDALEFL